MLSDLTKISAAVFGYAWNLHLKFAGPNFWENHKMLDKIKDAAYETTDRICECAIQHGENAVPTLEVPDADYTTAELKIIINNFVAEMQKMIGQYDAGVDNMLGDEIERWSKWADYFIARQLAAGV